MMLLLVPISLSANALHFESVMSPCVNSENNFGMQNSSGYFGLSYEQFCGIGDQGLSGSNIRGSESDPLSGEYLLLLSGGSHSK